MCLCVLCMSLLIGSNFTSSVFFFYNVTIVNVNLTQDTDLELSPVSRVNLVCVKVYKCAGFSKYVSLT